MDDTPVQMVLHGDCLEQLPQLRQVPIDVAYLDPPFFSQKVHRLSPRDRSEEFSFNDTWSSSREYLEFLRERLQATHQVLSPRGSVFLHCDRSASHWLRTLLDEVFGAEQFRAEIIWQYRRWSNSARGLLPAHQTILYYSKSAEFIFNEIWTEYSPSTNVDQILQRRTRDEFNKSVYDRDDLGLTIPGGAKRGVPLGDVWDIPFLNPKAKERTGYPTQKPLQLLERIITLAADQGSWILDPFCGSGTTLIAAQRLGRSAIGIDVSSRAVELTRQRLSAPVRSNSQLLSVGRDAYRNADDAVLRVLEGLDIVPVQRNSGIDALLKQHLRGGPVPIRVQRCGEAVREAAVKLHRASVSKSAAAMILVVTAQDNRFGFSEELPDGVLAVDSTAFCIRKLVRELSASEECVH